MKKTFKKIFAVLSATAMLGVSLPAGTLTAVATTGNDGIDYTIIDDGTTLRVSGSGTASVKIKNGISDSYEFD